MAKREPELPVAISHEKCEAIQQELEAETGKMEGRVAELDQRVQDLKESEGQAKDNVDDLVARLRGAELALDETSKKLDALKPPCHLDLAEELKQVDKLGSCKVEREFEGGDARNFRLLRASGASGSDEPQGELVIKRDGVLLTIRVVDKKLVLEKKGERAFELPDGLIGFTFEFDGDRRCVALFKEWRIHWEIDVTLEDAVVAHLPLPAELLGFFFAGLGVEQQSRRFLAVTAAEVDIDIENWTLDAEVKALPDARGIIELRKLRKDVREIEALLDSDKKEGGYGASQLLSKLRTGDDQVKETVEKLKGLVAKLDGDKPHVSEVKKEIGEIVKNDIQPPLDELEDELAQPIEIVLLTREGPRVEVDITLREREPG
ncbi:MAG: hypothetical protein HY720_14715 [Planctomycetes bacterium]|nr:hypothetical protein [Planctomycetota bacterium]